MYPTSHSMSSIPNVIASGRGYYPNHPTGDRGVAGRAMGPFYQIDFNAIATGKVIAMSKRQLKWRFGYPNKEALDAGKQGTDCRGEEHDVTLMWSVSSGKRRLLSNGRQILMEVHRGKMFEHTWVNERGNTLKIMAHATEPISHHMGSRQYDLWIDGISYFTLPKLYEVGLRGTVVHHRIPGLVIPISPSVRGSFEADLKGPRSEQEEQEELKRAVQASLEESRRYLISTGKLREGSAPVALTQTTDIVKSNVSHPEPPSKQVDLLDFFSEPEPTPPSHSSALVHIPMQHQYQVDLFSYDPNAAQHPQVNNFPSASIYPLLTEAAPPNTSAFAGNSGAYELSMSNNNNGPGALSPFAQNNYSDYAGNPFDTFSAPSNVPYDAPVTSFAGTPSAGSSTNYDPNFFQQLNYSTHQQTNQPHYDVQSVWQPSSNSQQPAYSQQSQYQHNQQQYQGQHY